MQPNPVAPTARRPAVTKRALLHLKNIVINLVVIATSDSIVPTRWGVLSSYLTTTARRILRRGRPANRRSIVGFDVTAPTSKALQLLFTDVFVKSRYLFRTDNPRPYVVDCGAGVGVPILYVRLLYPNAEIAAFEPDPRLFAMLGENLRRNGLTGVAIHHAAVGDTEGDVRPPDRLPEPGASKPVPVAPAQSGSGLVPCVRLSSFIDREVDLLRLDIGGGAHAVLADLARTGKLPFVRHVIVEYYHHTNGEDRLAGLLRTLEENGFGYQIDAPRRPTAGTDVFQTFLLHAYRKQGSATAPGNVFEPGSAVHATAQMAVR